MSRVAAILVVCWLAGAGGVALGAVLAPTSPGSPEESRAAVSTTGLTVEQARLVEQILELRQRLRDLEAQLSPEARRALEEQLVTLEAAAPTKSAALEAQKRTATARPDLAVDREIVAPRVERGSTGCNTLLPFDTSGDGAISGADRYWRYLRLWIDSDRNGAKEENEVVHPFEVGILEIDCGLRRFSTVDKVIGDIRRGDRLHFEPVGKRNESGILMVEASRIRRGDGLDFRSPAGEALEGLQEIRAGLIIRSAAGEETRIDCP